MKHFEIGLVFFIDQIENYNKSIQIKDKILDVLDEMPEIESYEVFSDEEDWNIECTATIASRFSQTGRIQAKLEKTLSKAEKIYLNEPISCCWDYHYIKGTDNNFMWEP